MLRRYLDPDSLAVTGAVLGLLAAFPGWLNLRPNRLAAGSVESLRDLEGWGVTAALMLLWSVCLLASLRGRRARGAAAAGLTASVILVAALVLAGMTSRRLVEQGGELTRVSPAGGFWLTLLAVYIVIFASRRQARSPVIREIISWSGLTVFLVLLFSGQLNGLSIIREYLVQQDRFREELARHVFIFAGSVTAGALLAVPLGVWAARSRRAAAPVFFLANITQTIPSLALFGLMIAPLSALSFAYPALRELGLRGVGVAPAVAALIIYSLLPVVRNTFVSLRQIDPAVTEAGLGMGMSRGRVFRKLEIPLAAPLILEGVRTAAVQSVGNTAVAALIGAGGLGWFIFQGFGQAAADLILLGAIPIIVLAVIVDGLMRVVVGLARPRGLAGEAR